MKKIFTFFIAMVAFMAIGYSQCGINFSYPYSCDFSYEIQNGCWSVNDANEDGSTWVIDTPTINPDLGMVAYYKYNSSNAADDDLFSGEIYFDGTQTLTFDYWCEWSSFTEKLEVYLYDPVADTYMSIMGQTTVSNTTATTETIDLTDVIGVYKLNFYVISDADRGYLYIDDITITSSNSCDPISEYPYENDFSDITRMTCWTVEDENEDGNTFNLYDDALCYRWNDAIDAEDDVYSPYFVLDGHQTLSFDYYCGSVAYPEYLSVYLYDGSYFYNIMETTEVTNTDAITQTIDLSEYTGTYKIDFYCTSDANMYRLYIDNFKIENTTGIEDNSKAAFALYPNPTTGLVNLSEVASRVEIYDFSGRMVMADENVNSINLSSQANGVYIFRITTNDNSVITKKVVKK